ncbi:hypothetical protein AB0D04_33580 [Streptomyces sp. NPDC048483]|uniref:hypothetical protein n=1 Tax=Streptomyces sp. NPDC048483 TaxID=3154927 RepID=UPI003423244E
MRPLLPLLPRVDTDEEWDAVVPDERVMRPGAAALCTHLGLRDATLTRYPTGSQPVYKVRGPGRWNAHRFAEVSAHGGEEAEETTA